jgi:uncharacterized protein YdaU (DUF1376 family)
MTAEIAMPVNAAAALSETAELSAEEFGAFVRLNYQLWVRGGAIPADPGSLARLAGVDTAQWPRVWQVIGHLFVSSGTQVSRPALSASLEAQKALAEARSAKGTALAAARWAAKAKKNGGGNGGSKAERMLTALQGAEPTGERDAKPPAELSSECAALLAIRVGGLGGSSLGSDLSSLSAPDPGSAISKASGSGNKHTRGPVGSSSNADSIRAVFAHYRAFHPRAYPTPLPGSKEWAKIASRLREGYTVEDLCRAIDGYHADPFHCGDNDRNRAYLGLELLMRDGTHVATGLEYADKPAGTLNERNRATARGVSSWAQRKLAERNGCKELGRAHG